MEITFPPAARETVRAWLAQAPSRPALRLCFAGGCGALGYRLAPAPLQSRPGDNILDSDGITIYVDYKSSLDLDGATIEMGESPDDIVVVHDRCVVGGMC